MMPERQRGCRGGRPTVALCLLGGVLAITSCQGLPSPAVIPSFLQADSRTTAQEGELTLADGGEATVAYKKVFESPPRLAIVEFRRSWFKDKPYAKTDFVFLEQSATGFRVQNTHPEQGLGAVATVKWRAEGVVAAVQPPPAPVGLAALAGKGPLTTPQLAAAVKALGGTAIQDLAAPGQPIVSLDFHHTRVSDADLEHLRTLGQLRSLNLSGTAITDAGLASLENLTSLQVLQLSSTRVSDAGVPHLRGLTQLRELSFYHTHVTDDGLASLKGLVNLHDLTLSGPRITDAGLTQLAGLKDLRHLYLGQTGVSKAGAQALKKALPKIEIIQ